MQRQLPSRTFNSAEANDKHMWMPQHVFDRWFPIILARPDGSPSDQDHQKFLAETADILERYRTERRRIVMLLDLSQAGGLSATQHRSQVDWLHRYRPLIDEAQVGLPFVIPSKSMRGMLAGIF